jgi:hypothetical protein
VNWSFSQTRFRQTKAGYQMTGQFQAPFDGSIHVELGTRDEARLERSRA